MPEKMNQPPFWYNLLIKLAIPFFKQKIKKRSAFESDLSQELTERFMPPHVSTFSQRPLWIHAVSVGETNAAIPLIEVLLGQGEQILLTHTTRTGRARSLSHFEEAIKNSQLEVRFIPADERSLIEQFLNVYHPKWVGFIETELWPNTLFICQTLGIPTLLLNGRLSEKSAAGYKRFSRMTKSMLTNLTALAVQNAATAQRFIELGTDSQKVHVLGNLKFDQYTPAHLSKQLELLNEQHVLDNRSILVAASTHADEEAQILKAFQTFSHKFPEAVLVLAPRHPERFDEVHDQIKQTRLPYARYSQQESIQATTKVYLLDALGQLWPWYQKADLAFVGGSLVDVGGHNPIEPALVNTATVVGPFTTNFNEVVETFLKSNAIKVVQSPQDLMDHWQLLIELPHVAHQQAEKALTVIKQNQGALLRHLELLQPYTNAS